MLSTRGVKWLHLLLVMQSATLLVWYFIFDHNNKYILIVFSVILALTGLAVLLQILRDISQSEPPQMQQAEQIFEEVKKEQTRIAAELHDTLGLQILQALTLLEAQPPLPPHLAKELLEHSLLDLRLIVDSMESQNESLALQMAKLRHRLAPTLTHKGLQLHWSISDPELGVGPSTMCPLPRGKTAHQILSVCQSCLCNIVEHSHASEIWVTLQPLQSHSSQHQDWNWFLSVEDNGCGFNLSSILSDASQGGQGIKNMFRRMAHIGADLQILARPEGGTKVLVRWRELKLLE